MIDLKQQTVDTYNTAAEAMVQKFNEIGARVDDIERGLSYIADKNPFIFEIGCGTGRDAVEILKHTNNYFGIDISESMIRVAKETAPDGRFEVADIENFKLPNNIDLIFSFASLLHSDRNSLKKVFNSMSKSLKRGGIFYISLKYGEGQYTKTDKFGTRTYFLYKPDDIKDLAGKNYEVVWEDTQELRNQKWFTIVLRRV